MNKITFKSDVFLILMAVLVAGIMVHPDAFAAGTTVVEDHAGKKVRMPAFPERVVALAPSVTEIVFAVGRGDRLVGATRFSNYPGEAKSLPSVGSYVYLDLERIVSLRPDLCIAIKDGNPLQTIRRIESVGIPVYAIDPMGINTVIRSVRDIGNLLNAETEAMKVISDMEERMERIDNLVSGVNEKPSVFFQIGVSPIVSAGSGTFIDELIERAGGVNAAGKTTGYPRFSKEEVLAMAPDVMILTSMERYKVFDMVMEEWRQWQNVPAVRDNRIYMVDSDIFDRPSPRLVEGLETLAALLHPDLFEQNAVSMRKHPFHKK